MKETGIRDLPVTVTLRENSFAMPEYVDRIVPFPGATMVLKGCIDDPKLRSSQIWETLLQLASCVAYKMGKSRLEEYKDEPTFARVTFGRRTRIIRTLMEPAAAWAIEITKTPAEETQERPRRRRKAG